MDSTRIRTLDKVRPSTDCPSPRVETFSTSLKNLSSEGADGCGWRDPRSVPLVWRSHLNNRGPPRHLRMRALMACRSDTPLRPVRRPRLKGADDEILPLELELEDRVGGRLGLITRRSLVQIEPPRPDNESVATGFRLARGSVITFVPRVRHRRPWQWPSAGTGYEGQRRDRLLLADARPAPVAHALGEGRVQP